MEHEKSHAPAVGVAEIASPGRTIAEEHDGEDGQDDFQDNGHEAAYFFLGRGRGMGRETAGNRHLAAHPDALPRFGEACLPKSTMAKGAHHFHPVWSLTGCRHHLQ